MEKKYLDEIKELIQLLKGNNLTEIWFERRDFKIGIKKEKEKSEKLFKEYSILQEETKSSEVPPSKYIPITSPMVGIFRRGPTPTSPPFVEKGSVIEVGQIVCIIEAMKLLNEVRSEIKGKIIDILEEDGKPVEYGQPLFLVEILE